MCGFCKKSKEELRNEIDSGLVVVKSSSEAPSGVRGFPYFVNTKNGKTHTGYASKDNLFNSLGVTNEGYERCSCEGINHRRVGYLKLSQTWS
jgi:hypothetical protein